MRSFSEVGVLIRFTPLFEKYFAKVFLFEFKNQVTETTATKTPQIKKHLFRVTDGDFGSHLFRVTR